MNTNISKKHGRKVYGILTWGMFSKTRDVRLAYWKNKGIFGTKKAAENKAAWVRGHIPHEADCEVSEIGVAKRWKIYGADGHRQHEAFRPSFKWDFSSGKSGLCVIEVRAADKTRTHDYVEVIIIRPTAELCEEELQGQITDGIFENARVGKIEEIY